MKDIERQWAVKLSNKIKSVRMSCGYEQEDLAGLLNLNQSKVSRFESAKLAISTCNWIRLGRLLNLSEKSIVNADFDYIDDFKNITLHNRDKLGKYSFCKRYSNDKDIAVRTIIPLFEAFQKIEKWEKVFKKKFKGLDPAYFYNLDNVVNMTFVYDLIAALKEHNLYSEFTIRSSIKNLSCYKSFSKENDFEKNHKKYFKSFDVDLNGGQLTLIPKEHVVSNRKVNKEALEAFSEYLSVFMSSCFKIKVKEFEVLNSKEINLSVKPRKNNEKISLKEEALKIVS